MRKSIFSWVCICIAGIISLGQGASIAAENLSDIECATDNYDLEIDQFSLSNHGSDKQTTVKNALMTTQNDLETLQALVAQQELALLHQDLLLQTMATYLESDLVLSQTPTQTWGGHMSVAEPYEPTGGWNAVYRAADDFTPTQDCNICVARWWGGSYDGRHGETDSIDNVREFLIEIYRSEPNSSQPEDLLYSFILPRENSFITLTDQELYGDSDVFSLVVEFPEPVPVEADTHYWFSVSAYLDESPMWVWLKSDDGTPNASIDYDVNGVWGDQPWNSKKSLAFELRSSETIVNESM